MSIKEVIFVLFDLGISLAALSTLYKEANEQQLNSLLNGDYLELQFSLGAFNDNDIERISNKASIQKSRSIISRKIKEFSEKNIQYYIYYEDDYPDSLKYIPSPPFFIFLMGNRKLLKDKFICSIVGTRNPSTATLEQIDKTVDEMVKSDIAIASGLALGTDIQAHKSALNRNGKAIAVLPSPVNDVVPKNHIAYANEILEKDGLLMSEYYKKDAFFRKSNYINRNRIISGISNAVIIAECSEKSGTMHTARYAYKQKRPLFCFNNSSTGVSKILSTNTARIYSNLKDLHT